MRQADFPRRSSSRSKRCGWNPTIPGHLDLGLVLDRLGHTADAIQQYRQAIRAEPDYAQAYYNLGRALDQSGCTADAIQQYRRAIRAQPDYAQAHHNLGYALYACGNTEEAIEHYQRAIRIDPTYALAHFNLARACSTRARQPRPSNITNRQYD